MSEKITNILVTFMIMMFFSSVVMLIIILMGWYGLLALVFVLMLSVFILYKKSYEFRNDVCTAKNKFLVSFNYKPRWRAFTKQYLGWEYIEINGEDWGFSENLIRRLRKDEHGQAYILLEPGRKRGSEAISRRNPKFL